MDKLIIDVGFANLAVEKYNNNIAIPEFIIYLEHKQTGLPIQDIILVRQLSNPKANEIIPKVIECLVWSDCHDKNYTHRFTIDHYDEK